jgi:hypothetical protein
VQRSSVLLASIIGFGVLYLLASLALGTTPSPHDSGEVVSAWFRHNGGHVRLWLWLLTLSLPLLGIFGAIIRGQLPDGYGDVFLLGITTFIAETAVQGWIWAGASWHAAQLAPSTARTVLDAASFWGPVLNSATVLTLAPITVLAFTSGHRLPRWIGYIAGLALIEQLVETVTIFGQSGFIAPGGAMNLYLGGGLVAVSWLALGISTARSIPDSRRQP